MKRQSGQTIIELLFTIGFSLIIIPALFSMFFISREGRPQQQRRTQAVALVSEAEEAVRSVREMGWDAFLVYQTGVSYHPRISGGTWSLVSGSESIEGFTRSITISPVYRKASGAIGTSSDILDLSTRLVTVTVSWTTPLPSSVTTTLYVTRHSNLLQTDTTVEDFNAGIKTNTGVSNLFGGEVVLGSTGGFGDWCTPNLTISALDLPKSGVANAIGAIQGQIAAGTGDNASGVSYANVSISDPAYPTPPVASVSGTFDGYKTNDVFTEQNYAYLATDTNTKEVEIVDLTHSTAGKYSEAGYFDAPGNGNSTSVATSGSVGYMIDSTKLYSFDLSSHTGSRPIKDPDGVGLPGAGNKIVIVGSRAFIADESTSSQLVIVDISNPDNLTIKDTVALPSRGAASLFVNASGTRAYVVTHYLSASEKNFFIVNVDQSSPQYKQILGTYNTAGMDPKGVVVVSGPRAILVGTGGQQYQVLDITTETTVPLPKCGGLTVASGIRGISTVFTGAQRAYSYIVTGDASSELKIIEGGLGATGKDYVLNGTFVSRIFDVQSISSISAQAAFNRISATIVKSPPVTDISMKVAIANAVSGSCTNANYVYVGPDGTTGTSYTSTDNATIVGAIPFASGGTGFVNPGRCFRYQVSLSTTDPTLTSQLGDVTVSFSP